MNSNIYCIIVASSGQLVRRNQLIHLFISSFSSLFLSLGRTSLLLFVSLSYKFIVLGRGWTDLATILNGRWLLVSLVLNIYIYIYINSLREILIRFKIEFWFCYFFLYKLNCLYFSCYYFSKLISIFFILFLFKYFVCQDLEHNKL